MSLKIINKLQMIYDSFFQDMEIDKDTGRFIKNNFLKRFPTYPYIGSKYGQNDIPKILFIGLDVGADDKNKLPSSFDNRRKSIENGNRNPHISGTYLSSLYFLKSYFDYNNYLSNFLNLKITAPFKNGLQRPAENPLSYVALTNYYKFVTIGKGKASGDENRNYINKNIEIDFFIKEVEIFNPDIIIFQSVTFRNKKNIISQLKELGIQIHIGYHPAYINRCGKTTSDLIKSIKES